MLTKDNNLNIRQFKLLNGEEIIALVNEKDDSNYIIERPYKVNAGMVGGFYFVPWFPFSSQKLFKLSREKIVYHAELDEDMKQEYVKLASEFSIDWICLLLTAFVLFKISAFMYLLQDIKEGKERSWLKLFQVFVVDLIILIIGVVGTGILFMTLLKMAHG
mgnify:CR=1 FL=1